MSGPSRGLVRQTDRRTFTTGQAPIRSSIPPPCIITSAPQQARPQTSPPTTTISSSCCSSTRSRRSRTRCKLLSAQLAAAWLLSRASGRWPTWPRMARSRTQPRIARRLASCRHPSQRSMDMRASISIRLLARYSPRWPHAYPTMRHMCVRICIAASTARRQQLPHT